MLIDKERRYLYLSFAMMFVVAIFLGSGTHPPTGNYFRWLVDHLPFFSLFRSPWYIFTPLLVLSYSGLIALLFFKLGRVFGKMTYLGAIILIIGNLLYSYPLVAGKIFRTERPDTFYVKFPEYVFHAQKWLNENKSDARIVGYPDDEIEQFNWGYRGIDSILTLFTDREVLFSPLNMPNSQLALLVKQFYALLKKGEIDSALKIASKLNVGLLFERGDQKSLSVPLPGDIGRFPKDVFGKWTFYKLPVEQGKIRVSSQFLFAYPYSKGSEIVAVIDYPEVLLNPSDSMVNKSPLIMHTAGKVILAENSQEKAFTEYLGQGSGNSQNFVNRRGESVEYHFEIPEKGNYQPRLESYHLQNFGIDPKMPLTLTVDGEEKIWRPEKIGDYVIYKDVDFSEGSHKVIINLDNKNLLPEGNFEGEEAFEKRGEGIFEIKEENGNKFLSMLNRGEKDIWVQYQLPSFDPNVPYLINFKYRHIYGNKANVLVGQSNKDTPIKKDLQKLPKYPGWVYFSFYYLPVNAESEMILSLLSPFAEDPLGTTVYYDDLSIYKVFTNRLLFYKQGGSLGLSFPEVVYEKISAVEYKGEVKNVSMPHVISFAESYSPDWEIKILDSKDKVINPFKLHFSSNLYGNSWYLEGTPETYKFRIYYKPQKLFNLGAFISIVTILVVLSFGIRKRLFSKIKRYL